jgi:hypothetical protein
MLSKEVKVSQAITVTAGAAGVTTINGAVLDMMGWDGVLIVVTFGAIVATGVQSIKAQQDTAVGMGAAADLAGTGQAVADTDDEKTFFIDLYRPQERYVRVVVPRATANATVASAEYIQYRGAKKPSTHGANVAGETFASPAEGVA